MNWEKVLFNSGDLFLPTPVKAFLEQYWIGDDTSLFYVSWWTFIHFVSGLIVARWVTVRYAVGFAIHTVWELWQIIGKNTKYWTLRGQIDIVVDTAAFMLGMWVVPQN